MKKRTYAPLVVGMALALALPGAAFGAEEPQALIQSPAHGATISKSTVNNLLPVSGLAFFETPEPTERRFYLRRAGCGQGQDNTTYLSIQAGSGETNCGYITGWNLLGTIDEESFAQSYASVDGAPFTLDASRPITGRIRMSSDLIGFGTANVTATLTADSTTGSFELGRQTQTASGPILQTVDYSFTFSPPASTDKVDFQSLTLNVSVTGPGANHGWVNLNGQSYFTLSTYSASFNRRVDVGLNSASATATGIATNAAAGTFSGTKPIANLNPGQHLVKARAIQGNVVGPFHEITINLTS